VARLGVVMRKPVPPRRRRALAAVLAGIGAASALLAVAAVPAGAAQPRVTASYSCSIPAVGTVTATATVAGKSPASAAPGAKVSVSRYQSTVAIPGSALDTAYSYGVRWITAKVTKLYINATDAKSRSVNVAKTPITFSKVTLKASNNPPLTLHIPSKPATEGSWTASAKGIMNFSTGSASISLGSNLGTFTATCSPSPAATISKTSVT
jgi:hypothetical protein